MPLDALNHKLFAAFDATGAGPGVTWFLKVLAEGPIWLLPILLAAIWLLGRCADRNAATMAGLAGCLALAAAHVASVAIDHPRPFMIGLAPNLLDHAADSSFPSDHATLFFALAVAFGRRPVQCLPGLSWLLGCLGWAVGLARVALGVHFPFDVLGAALIGAAAALVTDRSLRRPVAMLVAIGESARRLSRPLADRDSRERAEHAHAHPSR